MTLVLGASYAARLRARQERDFSAVGWPGARLCDERLQMWAMQQAADRRPQQVMLMIGGNDLARPDFRQRQFRSYMQALTLGLLAAGVARVIIFPIPPRHRLRHRDFTREQYRRRQRLANRIMRRSYRREPVINPTFRVPPGFLSADGVHPSEAGWQAIVQFIRMHC